MKNLRADSDRFGIRARLLTLLLPGILGLLAIDSWNDQRALGTIVREAYDQTMLESVAALRSSLTIASNGSFQLNAQFVEQTRINDTCQQHKHLHVGLIRHFPAQAGGAVAEPELTLLGEPDLPAPPAALAPSTTWYDSTYRGYAVRVVALRSIVVDGRGQSFDLLIQAAESATPRDQVLATSSTQALLRDARMVLVVVLLVWLGVTWSLQPLERLRKSVLDSRGRDLKPLNTGDVPHEVAPLVEAVNLHVANYRDLLDRQAQFLADASHQLRTPLAIMMTQAGVALREKDPAELRGTLRAIVAQISRSRRLCQQLLTMAHAGDGTPHADAARVLDLNAIAKDVVLQYLALAHDKNLDLGWTGVDVGPEHSGAPLVPVLANEAELHEVLSNLVHNAIVYTPPKGRITVTVSIHNDRAIVEVRDDGPGIAPERRYEVFERFHHKGGKEPHGAGLGLAIARAYARRNGGDISLENAGTIGPADGNAQGNGLSAVLHLPSHQTG